MLSTITNFLSLVTDVIRPPEWYVALCMWLWRKRELFWVTIILGVIINLFSTWLVTPFSATYRNTPVGWAMQHPSYGFLLGTSIIAVNVLVYLSTFFDRGSDIQTERKYARRMQEETRVLKLTGIPADLIAPGVPLDEVFIPLRFKRNQPRTDLPLAEREYYELDESIRDSAGSVIAQERARIRHQAITSSWSRRDDERVTLSIADLWQLLTPTQPAAVIQGFPGMGKSTLLERLTLHMARRGLTPDRLDQPTDPLLFDSHSVVLAPVLVPILIRLSDYAEECKRTPNLSISDYLLRVALRRLDIRRVAQVIEKRLESGRCLVLFDGLDEVSDPHIRVYIQGAIQTFVNNWSLASGSVSTDYFNRFIITSRVAGYDPNAFPDYVNVVIAELTPHQIDGFLPHWYRATVRRDRGVTTVDVGGREAMIFREAERHAALLSTAIHTQQGVRELAVNPLLLSLLAVMQLNGIELPRQRVDLYRIVTLTLLENRNIAKGLPEIAEAEAMQRLGPLAYRMQSEGKRFISHHDVLDSIEQTIMATQGGTAEQVAREAVQFVKRVRERAGIFVQRTDDYYGFFHRTFQEYFAARYLLGKIAIDPNAIVNIAAQARRNDALWREPILFAVAYKSRDGDDVASNIIRAILATPATSEVDLQLHDLLLAAECVIEAKPLSIDGPLCQRIVEELCQLYEATYQTHDTPMLGRIEDVMRRWLASVHQDAYQHPLLDNLAADLRGERGPERLCATLTLLAVVAKQLGDCRTVVFRTLVPPLVARAELFDAHSEQSNRQLPDTANGHIVDTSSDPGVAERALAVLARMRGPGSPGSELLGQVRRQVADHPEYLHALAQCSVDSHMLVTPVIAPWEGETHARYVSAFRRWQQVMLQTAHRGRTRLRAVTASVVLHRELLDTAEQARYPSAGDVLQALQAITEHPSAPWQNIWQAHLAGELEKGHYGTYQNAVLLWLTLFRDPAALASLAVQLERHFMGSDRELQRCSCRVLAVLSDARRDGPTQQDAQLLHDFSFLLSQQDARFLFQLEDQLKLRYRRFPQTKQELRRLMERLNVESVSALITKYQLELDKSTGADPSLTAYPRNLGVLRTLYEVEQIRFWRVLQVARPALDTPFQAGIEATDSESDQFGMPGVPTATESDDLRYVQDRRDVRRALFSPRVAEHARTWLTRVTDSTTDTTAMAPALVVDLIKILRGRVLHLAELNELGDTDALELEQTAQVILDVLAATHEAAIVDASLRLLRSFPVRSSSEAEVVLQLASQTADAQVHAACAQALFCATPCTLAAWVALREGSSLQSPTVRAALEARLDVIGKLDEHLQQVSGSTFKSWRNMLREKHLVVQ